MKFFIKKMLSQESGYSGGKPNQRGSYISIPKKAWFYFPTFKDKILNPKEFVTFKINEFEYFTLEFVWHNSSLIPENLSERRNKNNERRIYTSKEFKSSTLIDKDSFLVLEKNENSSSTFNLKVINKSDLQYNEMSDIFQKNYSGNDSFFFSDELKILV